MTTMRERAQQVAEELIGTCQSLSEVLEDDFDALTDNKDFTDELDQLVTLCEGCGWWAESDEFDEGAMCAECQE